MKELVLAASVFAASHMVGAVRPARAAIVAQIGERAYLALYSLVALALLGWLVLAYQRAAHVVLWSSHSWGHWVALVLMALACVLLVAGLSCPNPLSLSFRSAAWDPARPGIVAATRHPAPWALALWSAVHAVANGDSASLVLFGFLFLLSVAGTFALDARRHRTLGAEAWNRLAGATSNAPFAALVQRRYPFSAVFVPAGPILAGIALYVAMILAHERIVGVSPFPW